MKLHTMPIITGRARQKLPRYLQVREALLEQVKEKAIADEMRRAREASRRERKLAIEAAAARRDSYMMPPPDPNAAAHRAALDEVSSR